MFVLGCPCKLPISDLLSVLAAGAVQTWNTNCLAIGFSGLQFIYRFPQQTGQEVSIIFFPLTSWAPCHHLSSIVLKLRSPGPKISSEGRCWKMSFLRTQLKTSLSLESQCHRKLTGSNPGLFASLGGARFHWSTCSSFPSLENELDYMTQPDLELGDLPASASSVLKLQASTNIPGILWSWSVGLKSV